MGCLLILYLFSCCLFFMREQIFLFKSCLQFQTAAFMPLIWRNPKNTARGASFICWIMAAWQMGCQGSAWQLGAAVSPSHPCLSSWLCSSLAEPQEDTAHPHSPCWIPPSRETASPGSSEVLRSRNGLVAGGRESIHVGAPSLLSTKRFASSISMAVEGPGLS